MPSLDGNKCPTVCSPSVPTSLDPSPLVSEHTSSLCYATTDSLVPTATVCVRSRISVLGGLDGKSDVPRFIRRHTSQVRVSSYPAPPRGLLLRRSSLSAKTTLRCAGLRQDARAILSQYTSRVQSCQRARRCGTNPRSLLPPTSTCSPSAL